MGIAALRGAFGFLTRIPVGRDERAWEAFRRSPVTFPVVGYVLGALLTLPFLLPLPDPTIAVVFVLWLYFLTGIAHVDGLADVGDALVVHGPADDRREVLKDTTVGVGALLSVVVVVTGLVLAALALAAEPHTAILLLVAGEVGAKLGMATIACLGTATHDGLGAELTEATRPRSVLIPTVVALPAAALTWPHPAALVALGGGLLATVTVFVWARWRLGGVNGDVFGAGNEIARLVALHVGVIAWTGL